MKTDTADQIIKAEATFAAIERLKPPPIADVDRVRLPFENAQEALLRRAAKLAEQLTNELNQAQSTEGGGS